MRALLLLLALAGPAGAEEATEGLGLSIVQGGAAVPLSRDVGPGDGSVSYGAALRPEPFELRLPPDPCPPEEAGTAIRVVAGDVAEALRGALAASGLSGEALRELAFPPGGGMAAEAGPLTALLSGDEGAAVFARPFNYVFGDRYAAQGPAGDAVEVREVMVKGRDLLSEGRDFTLIVGRGGCAVGPGATPVEVVRVGFGG